MSKKALVAAIVMAMSGLGCNLGIMGESISTPQPTDTEPPATPSGTEQATDLVGDYYCSGHEAGMLAAAAMLELTADGQVIDVPPPGLGGERATGSWQYQPEANQVEFEGELDFSSGEYSYGSGRLVIHLNEGVQRVHAEEGVMTCEPR
ncbi:MAG: hypothetical protein ACLFWD_01175 [Anaerolineales bacterium]